MTGRLRQVGFRAAGAAALIPSYIIDLFFSQWILFGLISREHINPRKHLIVQIGQYLASRNIKIKRFVHRAKVLPFVFFVESDREVEVRTTTVVREE